MRVPISWLRDYVHFTQSVEELAAAITLAGLEVKQVERIGGEWGHVFVGEVERVEPHPNADSLVLATVRHGQDSLTVVTGAPNIAAGQKVALALAGAVLVDAYAETPRKKKLKPSTIRGVRSEGMVCSGKELGMSDEHEGILVLPPDAPVGRPLAELLGDWVLEIELTPNFAYANSMVGLAREVAAICGGTLRQPTLSPYASAEAGCSALIQGDGLVRRYMLQRLDNLSIKPSSAYIQERLRASGMRPINNVVDVSNYVMLEYGQPMHPFDAARVSGEVVVRPSLDGEQFETLDGQTRSLPPGTVMIADAERSIGIGGIMGGRNSEVTESTTSILLESATFDPVRIRRSSRAMGMRTEASGRFEKGMDPDLAAIALVRAVRLLEEEAGAVPVHGAYDWYPDRSLPAPVRLPHAEIARQLGVRIPPPEVERILLALGFEVGVQPDAVVATPPSYRRDVTRAADLVEEVGRVHGYGHLPSVLPTGELPVQRTDQGALLERQAREWLAAAGWQEVVNYDLTSEAALEPLRPLRSLGGPPPSESAESPVLDARPRAVPPLGGPRLWEPAEKLLRVLNPLSSERVLLRPSLLPGILQNVRDNARHEDRVWLFELDRVFIPRGAELPDEPKRFALALYGDRFPRSPQLPHASADLLDVKGSLEGLFRALNVGGYSLSALEDRPEGVRSGLAVEVGGSCAGYILELSDGIREQLDLDRPVVVAELEWSLIARAANPVRQFRDYSRFPPVLQDLAVEAPEATPAAAVEGLIRRFGGRTLRTVQLVEVYQGPPVPAGAKSLLYRLSFGSPDRTLTEEDATKARRSVERALREQLGARIRGVDDR